MASITLSPKDTTDKLQLNDVQLTWQEGLLYCVLFDNGSIRRYPLMHLWYIETGGTQGHGLTK